MGVLSPTIKHPIAPKTSSVAWQKIIRWADCSTTPPRNTGGNSTPTPETENWPSKSTKIAVNLLALNEWEFIGWRALEEHLTQPLVQFRQDVGDFRRCTIFDTAGNKRAAEPQECVGLERAAVWEKESVEERLIDAFLGRPNAA